MKQNNIMQVKKWNYGNYSNDNYGAHCLAIELGTRTLYFSYDTIVAFRGTNSKGKYFNVIHQNKWGNTTGKHLNCINADKSIRVSDEDFNKALNEFLK